MIAQNTASIEVVGFSDLKPLATANGPCLTAVVPLPDPLQMESQIKSAIHGLQTKMTAHGLDPGMASTLLAPITDLATTVQTEAPWAHALIVLRSPDLFRYYLLHGKFTGVQNVGDRFLIRPLLQTLVHGTRFHLLALSQGDVRLLHCTQHHLELAPTTREFPHSLQEWLNNRQPDHVLASRSSAGPSVGRMKGVVGGTSSDREREDEYLHHFFQQVDKAVIGNLRGDTAPLVLAGVEYELAIYRRVNSYKPTLEKAIHGSPDGMPEHTLHARAMEVVTSTFSEAVLKVIAEMRERVGTAQSSTDPREIVKAAFEGRVLDLVVAANAEFWGTWNQETYQVEAPRREELLNAAALQTLGHGGRAFVLNESDMPVKAPAVAVFRF